MDDQRNHLLRERARIEFLYNSGNNSATSTYSKLLPVPGDSMIKAMYVDIFRGLGAVTETSVPDSRNQHPLSQPSQQMKINLRNHPKCQMHYNEMDHGGTKWIMSKRICVNAYPTIETEKNLCSLYYTAVDKRMVQIRKRVCDVLQRFSADSPECFHLVITYCYENLAVSF